MYLLFVLYTIGAQIVEVLVGRDSGHLSQVGATNRLRPADVVLVLLKAVGVLLV